MNMELVSISLADKIKEKGFPIKTRTEGKWGVTELKKVDILPTISHVLKWLRDEKKIWICVNPGSKGFNISIYNDVEQYYNNICDDWLFDYTLRKELYCYKNYEDAAIAGIKYALNNLI